MTSAVIHIVMVDLAKNSTLYIYSSSIFLTSVPALIFFPQSLARSSPFHAFCSFIRFFSVFTLSYPRPRLSKHWPLAIPRSDLATRFSISNSCRVWIFQLICVCIVIWTKSNVICERARAANKNVDWNICFRFALLFWCALCIVCRFYFVFIANLLLRSIQEYPRVSLRVAWNR